MLRDCSTGGRGQGRGLLGYAESTGALALPVGDEFDDTTTLLGGRTQLRVWWRGNRDWRVDTLDPAGERSMRVGPSGTWLWDFEDSRATRAADKSPGTVRLPRADDGLPPALAARLLSGATDAQASALPARRVAGRPADGLRVRPQDPHSSIDRVDVWADRASGIPVSVEVYAGARPARRCRRPSSTSAAGRPAAAATAFTPPPSARVRFGSRFDLVDAIARFSPAQPPGLLRGYPRQDPLEGTRGVGLYGSGVTQVAVADFRAVGGGPSTSSCGSPWGRHAVPAGTAVDVGPVALLLTRPDRSGIRWLLTGTMTPEGLAEGRRRAARRSRSNVVIRTEGLVKRYGALAAVDGIDLDVQPGDVYGFLGANGSGKTTTVRCLLGLVLATSGEVSVLGQSMPRHAATVLPRVGALVSRVPLRTDTSPAQRISPSSTRAARHRRVRWGAAVAVGATGWRRLCRSWACQPWAVVRCAPIRSACVSAGTGRCPPAAARAARP